MVEYSTTLPLICFIINERSSVIWTTVLNNLNYIGRMFATDKTLYPVFQVTFAVMFSHCQLIVEFDIKNN